MTVNFEKNWQEPGIIFVCVKQIVAKSPFLGPAYVVKAHPRAMMVDLNKNHNIFPIVRMVIIYSFFFMKCQ